MERKLENLLVKGSINNSSELQLFWNNMDEGSNINKEYCELRIYLKEGIATIIVPQNALFEKVTTPIEITFKDDLKVNYSSYIELCMQVPKDEAYILRHKLTGKQFTIADLLLLDTTWFSLGELQSPQNILNAGNIVIREYKVFHKTYVIRCDFELVKEATNPYSTIVTITDVLMEQSEKIAA